jgi:hypothetical protein
MPPPIGRPVYCDAHWILKFLVRQSVFLGRAKKVAAEPSKNSFWELPDNIFAVRFSVQLSEITKQYLRVADVRLCGSGINGGSISCNHYRHIYRLLLCAI